MAMSNGNAINICSGKIGISPTATATRHQTASPTVSPAYWQTVLIRGVYKVWIIKNFVKSVLDQLFCKFGDCSISRVIECKPLCISLLSLNTMLYEP